VHEEDVCRIRAGILWNREDIGDGMLNRVADYLRGVRQEVTRVSWPTRNEVISLTALILILVVIVTLYIWGVDGILGTIVRVFATTG